MNIMNYFEKLLNIYNYCSGAIMVNRKGIIEYYHNNCPGINSLSKEEVIDKSLYDIFPKVTDKNSTIMEVMRTGERKLNVFQKQTNYKGQTYNALCNTFPIFDGMKIVGAIEIFDFLENKDTYYNIDIAGFDFSDQGTESNLLNIVSVSNVMQKLKENIMKVALTKSAVLIYGETGTGKELVAKAIHNSGNRRNHRFISQNCAAIPENLLESILFGTVKGSFTGAENHQGLFEAANGGTLFLDEINSMDIVVQAKILKAIEEQKIRRIGSTKEINVDVRIIAATNVLPTECVNNKTLREDLYYRLKVVELTIPPLRERKEDIEQLVQYYLNFFNETMERKIYGVEDEVMKSFLAHSWPGNVRELRNLIERGFNLCDTDKIRIEDLNFQPINSLDLESNTFNASITKGIGLNESVKTFECNLIKRFIYENKTLLEAAEKMGITRQTLYNKMKEYNINCFEEY